MKDIDGGLHPAGDGQDQDPSKKQHIFSAVYHGYAQRTVTTTVGLKRSEV